MSYAGCYRRIFAISGTSSANPRRCFATINSTRNRSSLCLSPSQRTHDRQHRDPVLYCQSSRQFGSLMNRSNRFLFRVHDFLVSHFPRASQLVFKISPRTSFFLRGELIIAPKHPSHVPVTRCALIETHTTPTCAMTKRLAQSMGSTPNVIKHFNQYMRRMSILRTPFVLKLYSRPVYEVRQMVSAHRRLRRAKRVRAGIRLTILLVLCCTGIYLGRLAGQWLLSNQRQPPTPQSSQ